MLKKKKKDWMPSPGKKLKRKYFSLIMIFINFDCYDFHDCLIMTRGKIYLQTTFIHEVLELNIFVHLYLTQQLSFK